MGLRVSRAYYNEIDDEACGALRELMRIGLIAPGDIDNRSIKEVTPDDLQGYTQVHLCAGIGVWSYSARTAGWPDWRQLWTGSFPCQPYSNAGKRGGSDDPRHLWPDGFRLIRAARPFVVMGEQVAGSLGYGWFDGVRSDLASENFASRVVDIPACSIDAPHIRNRLAWIAERGAVADGAAGSGSADRDGRAGHEGHAAGSDVGDSDSDRRGGPGLPAGRQDREAGTNLTGADGRNAGKRSKPATTIRLSEANP